MDAKTLAKFLLFRNALQQFVAFTDGEWAIIQAELNVLTLKKKECFIEAGKVCNYIGFLVSGSLRSYYIKDGSEITTYFSLENEMATSYKSFLTRIPSPNTIECIEKTDLVVVSFASWQKLMTDERIAFKMERFGRLIAEFLIFCYDDRVTSLITLTPEERYLSLLKKSSNVIQRIPQHYIANYLGITPVSLSRIRRRIMEPATEFHKILD